jgi:DNA repair protein RecN (Recombination protein N)
MLQELRIAGLGVIDDALLPLGPGLTVLTGETGAGKTMVVGALMLLFGGRADATRIRAGASAATVDGRLQVDDALVIERVEDAGGELDTDGGVLLRRVIATGRSRAFVGGAPAPVGVLTDLAERLVAVHGQADQLRLTRPAQHRMALDRFAGIDTGPYAVAYQAWRDATDHLAERTSRTRELRLEAETLTRGLAEIDTAAPTPGEDVDVAALANRLAHADALRLAAKAAHDALVGDPDDPVGDRSDVAGLLGQARRAVGHLVGADHELDALGTRLDGLVASVADVGAELAAYRDQLDADPQRLARVEERRGVLTTLTRRYGPDLDAVLEWAASARQRLESLDVSDEALERLAARRDELAATTTELAIAVSNERSRVAAKLAAAITDEIHALAMPAARVIVDVRRRAPTVAGPTLTIDGALAGAGRSGIDDVTFLLQSHAEAPALPVGRGASGGELSRLMLAIEVSLADTDPVPTMVFDEVDAGVGGRAALELGRRLAVLAARHQVIVVTHLAQVAAFADQHIVVDKPATQSGVTRSDVRVVDGQQRLAELARMLGGTDSAAAREHAAELLESVSRSARSRPKGRRASKTAVRG